MPKRNIAFTIWIITIFSTIIISSTIYIQNKNLKEQSEIKSEVAGEDVAITAFIATKNITIRAYPEKRIPSTNNWDTHLNVIIRQSVDNAIVYSNTVDTNTGGEAILDVSTSGINPTIDYDFYLKGYSHLTKRFNNIRINRVDDYYDFTTSEDLLAGDTNMPSADDVVNSLDLSYIIMNLNNSDERADLNQEGLVNSLDLGNSVFNLNKYGENL